MRNLTKNIESVLLSLSGLSVLVACATNIPIIDDRKEENREPAQETVLQINCNSQDGARGSFLIKSDNNQPVLNFFGPNGHVDPRDYVKYRLQKIDSEVATFTIEHAISGSWAPSVVKLPKIFWRRTEQYGARGVVKIQTTTNETPPRSNPPEDWQCLYTQNIDFSR